MAFPTSATLVPTGVAPALAGITIGVYPSTNLSVTEVQRATAAGAASSLWATVWNVEATSSYEVTFMDRMALSTRTLYYKARHKRVGFSNSAFTNIVSGKPIAMGQVANPTPTAAGASRYVLAGVGLSTAGLSAGTPINLPVAITKTLILPFVPLTPQTTADKYGLGSGFVYPLSNAVTRNWAIPVVLPNGVTVTNLAARLWRGGAVNSAASVVFSRGSSTGAGATIATCTTTAVSAWQTKSVPVTELISVTKQYYATVQLLSSASQSARFMRAEITYTMPHLGTAY